MPQYTINFTTNANATIGELNRVISSVANLERIGRSITLDLNASGLSQSINTTFRQLDREIANAQRRLNRLQIGSSAFRSAQASIGFREGQRERGELIGQPLRLRGQAQSFEQGSIIRLEKELRALQIEASQIRPDSGEWLNFQQQIGRVKLDLDKAQQAAEAIQLRENLGAFSPGSLQQLNTALQLAQNRAKGVSPDTPEWRRLNQEIQFYERSIERISRKPLTTGQRMGAAGGAFLYGGGLGGGAGSALGGIAGGLAGGVPGAFAGAAVGQLVDNLGQYAAGIATIVAETNKAKIALAGVSNDFEDYSTALKSATDIGQKFLLPVSDATRQFTKLQASVRGAGFDTATTAKVFEGIGAAIIATGGNTESLNSALIATSQVFSKGKVSAEELRQQIGERLPGAFTIFAQAIGRSPQELDKLLQEGKVGLNDFIKFVEELNKRYGSTAELLANAPENAGPRLQVALNALAVSYGGFFQRTGAGFQLYAADLAKFLLDNDKAIKNTISQFIVFGQDLYNIFARIIKTITPLFSNFFSYIFTNFAKGINALAALAEQAEANAGGAEQRAQRSVELLYPNPIERAFKGGQAFQEALAVERAYEQGARRRAKSREQRVEELNKTMFGSFVPSSFGAGLGGQGTTGAAGAAAAQDSAAKQAKTNLEAFERLRDQLANAYNRAEIERIKQRYEVEKRLRDDLLSVQEAGANRLQRQNLGFIRALLNAERQRVEAVMEAQLQVREEAGSVAGGVPAVASQGGTGAVFGATGRVFNAPGWVHGHLQNQNRQALVQDTVQMVMALLSRGVGPELGSGARFRKGMTSQQIEKLVRQGIGAHKQYASGIGAIDLFVPQGTPVPVPVSGIQNLGGAAGVTGILPGGTQLMHLDPRSRSVGAGAPRKVGSNESRDTMAQARVDISKATLEVTTFNSELLKTSELTRAQAQYIADAFNVPNLLLDNELLKQRNDLIASGVDESTINLRLRLFEIENQYSDLQNRLPAILAEIGVAEKDRTKILDNLRLGLEAAREAEKQKNDETVRGSFLEKKRALEGQLALANIFDPRIERRERLRQENPAFSIGRIEQLAAAEERLIEAQQIKERLVGIASSIGDAFGQAFRGIISGTSSVREVLAGLFQSVADSFADMVARMIADWMKTQFLQGFQSIFSGFTGGLAGAFGAGGPAFNPAAFSGPALATGSAFGAGGVPSFAGAFSGAGFNAASFSGLELFANGGMVTGPTLGVLGEGRFNEAVVPLPDGRSIPVELGGGAGNIQSSIVINIDGNGRTSTDSSGSNASDFGRKIEGAVKQVIVNELRPGGVLAGGRR
jgi:tape measure domain-containing protein